MSLSRPARFPLLKLPFLCIEAVIKSSDIFDIIYFALISKRTRRIVKHLKISLRKIYIYLKDESKWINFYSYSKIWYFCETREKEFEPQSEDLRKDPLIFQNKSIPVYTSKADDVLNSFTDVNGTTALTMVMEFLNEVFKCSVQEVRIVGDNYPELGKIGFKSTVDLDIQHVEFQRRLGQAEYENLNSLLKNLEVTGACSFRMLETEMDFPCDAKLLKCKKFDFWSFDKIRISREILLQLEAPQLHLNRFSISAEDIGSFVTQWFQSNNRKFEYLYIEGLKTQISLEEFQRWNALPFSERNRLPSSKSIFHIDFSKGLEIVRHDGLVATIHVNGKRFLFYIWHNPHSTQVQPQRWQSIF